MSTYIVAILQPIQALAFEQGSEPADTTLHR